MNHIVEQQNTLDADLVDSVNLLLIQLKMGAKLLSRKTEKVKLDFVESSFIHLSYSGSKLPLSMKLSHLEIFKVSSRAEFLAKIQNNYLVSMPTYILLPLRNIVKGCWGVFYSLQNPYHLYGKTQFLTLRLDVSLSLHAKKIKRHEKTITKPIGCSLLHDWHFGGSSEISTS